MYSLNDSILIIPHILPNQYSWQLFSDKPGKIILNFFSCRKISNILPMQNPHNTFLLIFFISDLIRDEKYVYYYLHIFHLLWDLIWYWHQASTFPFFSSTLFSMCFAVDVGTTHCKRVLYFFALFNLMNGEIKFFRLFPLIEFEYGRPTTVKAAHFASFLKQGNLWICWYQLEKKNTFFKNKRLLLHYKCCTYQNISFFLTSGWNWLV